MSLFDKINQHKDTKNRKLVNKTIEKKEKKRIDVKNISGTEKNKRSIEIYLRERNLPQLEIESLDYSVFTKEDINKIAVCEVTNINKSKDKTNTTDDPRLGTIDKYLLCATCGKTNDECPGHLGMINLPAEIIHPFFRLSVIKVLQSVCNTCKKLLLSEKHIIESGIIQSSGYNRLLKISDYVTTNKIRCPNGCPDNPIFKPQRSGENKTIDMFSVKKIGKEERPYFYTVKKIKSILSGMTDKDVELLGFINNHPKNFIVDFVPVIPLSARPYVIRDGQIQDDYLTSTYSEIVSKKIEYYQNGCDVIDDKTNRIKVNATEDERKEECLKKIIFFIDHSIKNCDKVYKRSPSDVCKSINDRISGKESLIRGHMMGKRADFTGRTVLGPNRSISFGQIGTPIMMSYKLTVPERITKYNYNYVKLLSDSGRIDYLCPNLGPFAGRKLKYDSKKHNFNVGDKIGRFSENGDVVIFNRQPTLHRGSFLGYVCNFQDKLSVGIHLSSTNGHNADFDGDEGNIHMLQTIDAQVEARLMMFSGSNIMNYDFSSAEAGLVMSSLIGSYTLTRENFTMSEEEFQQGIESILRFTQTDYSMNNYETLFERAEMFGLPKYSGKVLASILFPKDFSYTYIMNDGSGVKIRKGILIEGSLKGHQLKSGAPSTIIQSLYKQYGRITAMNFITDSNFLFTWYAMKYGLTVSSEDVEVKNFKEFRNYKDEIIDNLNRDVESLPQLQSDATDMEIEEREVKIVQMINKESEHIKKKFFGSSGDQGYLDKNNSLYIMINSKAKGDEMQVGASSAFLGQQSPGGGRAKLSMSGGRRWLPTFHIDDRSIFSRGFARNSYYEGMNPDEMFVQCQAGRINMTDTALKTATTGHLQRKMMKAQENLIVRYDGTVRNHNNIIVQFNFGAGFNTSMMVYSYNNTGMKCRSFINLKEEIEKENTESGYGDFDITSHIVKYFNNLNSKYGDEKLVEENEEMIKINNLDDYHEIETFQDDEFELSISLDMD